LSLTTKASCGCTVVEHDQEIPAGGAGQIVAQLKTSNLHGTFQKTIELRTNDPQRPKMTLALTGRIVPTVEVLSGEKTVLPLSLSGPTVHELTLRGLAADQVAVTSADCDDALMALNLTPLDEAAEGKTYRLTLTIADDAPLGKSSFQIVLATTSPAEPQVISPLRCEKGIVISPANIRLNASAGAAATRSVLLSKHGGQFHVQEASSSDPSLELRTEPIQEGTSYRLTVTYRGTSGLPAPARLTILTDDPHQPRLEIPVVVSGPPAISSLGR
jgi:hypothetical protein